MQRQRVVSGLLLLAVVFAVLWWAWPKEDDGEPMAPVERGAEEPQAEPVLVGTGDVVPSRQIIAEATDSISEHS